MVIEDRWDVLDVRTKLVQGIDRRNWVQFRSCITDAVRLDYSAHDPNRIPGSIAGDRWTAYCRTLFTGLDATQHSLTNPLVRITGETATSTVYVVAEHMLRTGGDSKFYTLGGFYEDTLIRINGKWLLTDMRLAVTWSRGDRSILAEAMQRGATALGSSAETIPPGVAIDKSNNRLAE
ncbi:MULTISPECIES: nuclear transport factor 2 family protein [Nocardiaceae]|uniref:nuclear transport factor 2 family protein n=1 Tax=Nocardiaceae TaxID=85025 RepID=UPI00050C9F6F|nr:MULTISPECIES: nuclear transport factor 2 family protein [Rhodococcus]